MLFTSVYYLIFLTFSVVIFYLLKKEFRSKFLLFASILFYALFSLKFVIIIFLLITFNYFIGLSINKRTGSVKKKFLITGIIINILTLVIFKYTVFILDNIGVLTNIFGYNIPIPGLKIILPLGLSFYIFQAISYLLDIYQAKITAEKDPVIFSLYIIFFPKLISGPIERASNLIPQLKLPLNINPENLLNGLRMLLWGYFKKFVIADRLAVYVNSVYGNPEKHSALTLIITVFFYTIQIYADFSGYTNIALGSAKLFGIHLTNNFNRPYFSKSISEFWRRWHITLSSWIFDYIYTPVSYSKRKWGMAGTAFALFITFLLCGLWHGAAWTFVLWGVLHAIALIYDMLSRSIRSEISEHVPKYIYDPLSILFTFSFITFSLILFRSKDLEQFFYMTVHLFRNYHFANFQSILYSLTDHVGIYHLDFLITIVYLFIFILLELLFYFNKISGWISKTSMVVRWAGYSFMLFSILSFGAFTQKIFIYFQF